MKTPLEKQLENAYQIFNKDHEQLRESLLNSVPTPQIDTEQTARTKRSGLSIGEYIMNNKTFLKIAAGIIIVAIIAATFNLLTGSGSVTGVAFGEVLENIHNSRYTFDLTTEHEGQTGGVNKGMVLSGIMRLDAPDLDISSIINYTTNECLILFHKQKAAMTKIPDTNDTTNSTNPWAIFAGPIENLWNLKDGTEKSLGEKVINNQQAAGFEVQQQSENHSFNIVVWANKKTGNPIQIDITVYNPKVKIILNNFNLNVELDKTLFSTKLPEGYTLAYQNTIEETVKSTQSTKEAEKIVSSISLWSSGEQAQAIQALLDVDWTKPVKFSDREYFFTMSGKEIIQLKLSDRDKAEKEIGNTIEQVRGLCKKIWEVAQVSISAKEYDKAEQYLNATLELGRLIFRNAELAASPRVVGYSTIKKSLTYLQQLYQQSGQKEKLTQVQEQIKENEMEIEIFKKQILNITGG